MKGLQEYNMNLFRLVVAENEKQPEGMDGLFSKWQNATGSLFDDDTATSCMSYYGLCE